MSWVVGVVQEQGQQKFQVLFDEGRVEQVCVASLATIGLPSTQTSKRTVYKGEISTWTRTSGDEYLEAFGIAMPAGLTNKQAIFRSQLPDGTTILVPALALIRGLFRPHRTVLSRVFMPSNVDMLAFVDYAKNPPEVVFDAELTSAQSRDESGVRFEFLRWVHISASARLCAQSVYESSRAGSLNMRVPKGEFRMALHGLKMASTLYVTKLNVTSARVPADDSIKGEEQTFIFHGMATPERRVSSAPQCPDVSIPFVNQPVLTDDEWNMLASLFQRNKGDCRQRYCRRSLFEAILLKLSSDQPWKKVQEAYGFDKTTLTMTFRRWKLDGRLSRALAELESVRSK